MPPRATAAASAASTAQSQQDSILETEGIDAYELPKALITRIAKSGLPPTARFSHDTIIALNRGATVFINYLSASAQDVAHSKSHKTVAATDVLKALELLELPKIGETLQKELEIFRQEQKAGTKGKAKSTAETSTPPVASETTLPTPSAPASSSARARGNGDVVDAADPNHVVGQTAPRSSLSGSTKLPSSQTTLPPPPMQHPPLPYFSNPYAPPRPASSNLNPYTVSSGPYRPASVPAPGARKSDVGARPASNNSNGVFEDPLPPNTDSSTPSAANVQ